MANRQLIIDIIANDKASEVFNKIRASSMSMSSKLMGSLDNSIGMIDKMDRSLRVYNSTMYRFNNIASSVFRVAGSAIYDFTKDAINSFSELEQQHAKTVGVIATGYKKTAEEQAKFLSDSQKLKQQAIELGSVGPTGKGSLYKVTDVSYAQTSLAKSGMSADDMLNSDIIKSILQFAGGNNLDVDTATTFAVNLATMFDKPVEEWGKMLDMVTKAADISVIDVEDIMESLKYSGGITSGLGRNLEEILGVISVMGQAGLRGSMAGTGIQAFFTRLLSAGELTGAAAKNAPTQNVAKLYNQFVASTTNEDGSFKSMDEVSQLLNSAMSSLNDQEQAWFSKKLFGLFQMKAAYAISGSAEDKGGTISDYINQIANESENMNAIKYDIMLASQYGKIESLKNVWSGIKVDVGDKLSPVVTAIADELFAFLSNNGNYEINWDRLRTAIEESGELIGARYGEQLGSLVENTGNLLVDSGLVLNALSPEYIGMFDGIVALLNGDILEAFQIFNDSLDDTNSNIDNLPDELQSMARAVKNVTIMLLGLVGVNITTRILQMLTSLFGLIGRPIQALLGKIFKSKITSGKTDVDSASATVNIGKVSLMNVNANVVNIYGRYNMPNGNPSGGGGGGTPQLPGGGGSPLLQPGSGKSPIQLPGSSPLLLPSGSGSSGGGSGGRPILLPSGGGSPLPLPSESGGAGGLSKLGRGGLAGVGLAMTLSLGGSESDEVKKYRSEFDSKLSDINYLNDSYRKIVNELDTSGKLTYSFLEKLTTITGKDGKSSGDPQRIEKLLETLFPGNYKQGLLVPIRSGYTTQYVKDSIDKGNINQNIKQPTIINKTIDNKMDMSSLMSIPSISSKILTSTQRVTDNTQSIINGVNSAMSRIQNPILNVNVVTNVDKSGNATSKVTTNKLNGMGGFSDIVQRRASLYGATKR